MPGYHRAEGGVDPAPFIMIAPTRMKCAIMLYKVSLQFFTIHRLSTPVEAR